MAECVPIAVNQVDQLAEYAESRKIDLTWSDQRNLWYWVWLMNSKNAG